MFGDRNSKHNSKQIFLMCDKSVRSFKIVAWFFILMCDKSVRSFKIVAWLLNFDVRRKSSEVELPIVGKLIKKWLKFKKGLIGLINTGNSRTFFRGQSPFFLKNCSLVFYSDV